MVKKPSAVESHAERVLGKLDHVPLSVAALNAATRSFFNALKEIVDSGMSVNKEAQRSMVPVVKGFVQAVHGEYDIAMPYLQEGMPGVHEEFDHHRPANLPPTTLGELRERIAHVRKDIREVVLTQEAATTVEGRSSGKTKYPPRQFFETNDALYDAKIGMLDRALDAAHAVVAAEQKAAGRA